MEKEQKQRSERKHSASNSTKVKYQSWIEVFTDFLTHGVEFLFLETMITLLPEYLDYKVDAM
jgi:hypothetical protein